MRARAAAPRRRAQQRERGERRRAGERVGRVRVAVEERQPPVVAEERVEQLGADGRRA
jgi:hypothetical protein